MDKATDTLGASLPFMGLAADVSAMLPGSSQLPSRSPVDLLLAAASISIKLT